MEGLNRWNRHASACKTSKGRLNLAEDRTKRLWRDFEEKRRALAESDADLSDPDEPLVKALEAAKKPYVTDRQNISIPHLTSDQTADWTAEGEELPLDDPEGTAIVSEPKKLGVVTTITKEVLTDFEPAALILAEYTLIRALALALDRGFTRAAGSTPRSAG